MQITVKVTPKAKKNEVVDEGEFFRVRVTEAPEKGAANRACIKLLADYFDVPQRSVILLRGESARIKQFEIEIASA